MAICLFNKILYSYTWQETYVIYTISYENCPCRSKIYTLTRIIQNKKEWWCIDSLYSLWCWNVTGKRFIHQSIFVNKEKTVSNIECIYSRLWKLKKWSLSLLMGATQQISSGSQPDKQSSLRTHHNSTNKSPSLSLLFNTYKPTIHNSAYNLHYYVNLSSHFCVPVCASCSGYWPGEAWHQLVLQMC